MIFLYFAIFSCGFISGLFIAALIKHISGKLCAEKPSNNAVDGLNGKKTITEEETKALEHEKDLDKQFNRLMNYNGGREKKK